MHTDVGEALRHRLLYNPYFTTFNLLVSSLFRSIIVLVEQSIFVGTYASVFYCSVRFCQVCTIFGLCTVVWQLLLSVNGVIFHSS